LRFRIRLQHRGEKFSLLTVIALDTREPLSLLTVIALITSKPLSLLKVIKTIAKVVITHIIFCYTVPAIKIASPMLDTGIFQFAALQGEMDMDT
jgi:hypothetical protein